MIAVCECCKIQGCIQFRLNFALYISYYAIALSVALISPSTYYVSHLLKDIFLDGIPIAAVNPV